ncbi:MAG: hypothetical protein RIQ54_664 [Candidatus Parcubacteria bacterium]|jgi:hypothetical protein
MRILAIEEMSEYIEIMVDKSIAISGPRWGWNKKTKKEINRLVRRLKKAGKKVCVTIGWVGSYQSTSVSEGRCIPEVPNRPEDWDGWMSYNTRKIPGYSAFPGDTLIMVGGGYYNTNYDYHGPDGEEYLKNRYELKTAQEALEAVQNFAQ